jgi:hypothetical protein
MERGLPKPFQCRQARQGPQFDISSRHFTRQVDQAVHAERRNRSARDPNSDIVNVFERGDRQIISTDNPGSHSFHPCVLDEGDRATASTAEPMFPIFFTRGRRGPDYNARALARKQVKQRMSGIRSPNERAVVQPFPVNAPVNGDAEPAWRENLNARIVAEVE